MQQFTEIDAREFLPLSGPPEQVKRLVEQLQMFLPADQNGFGRVARLRFDPQIDLRQRLHQIENLCWRDRNAQPAQQAGEQQQVLEEFSINPSR